MKPVVKKLRPIFLGILIVAAFLPARQKTKAQEQFKTSYDIRYSVDTKGVTTVVQNIKIENKKDDILATTYSITVNQMEIYDVNGKDTAGPLEVDIKRDNAKNSTILSANLNDKIIGKGRANEIEISYKTNDLANKVGSIWNINLPRTANLNHVEDYKMKVEVPTEFGPKIFISPEPKDTPERNSTRIYTYTKEELEGESVTAAFGKNQVFNFKLDYHLENDGFLPLKQEIALPPDIRGRQQIYYEKLTPKPISVQKDQDGNVLALYKIKPKKDLIISLQGSAQIFGKQINPRFGGKMEAIPKSLKTTYTKEDLYWEIGHPKIQDLANELFDPKENVTENAENAYNYITDHLEYNYDIISEGYIERQGALRALTQEEPWACMEFTDLFIALARAMGIPSRELNGYAFSSAEDIVPVSIDLKSGDTLHSWAEFYDPNFGWVPVDPTWGTTSGIDYFTKLDTNHLAFVIKGIDSEYPYPAGSYRVNPEEKQVTVDFAENDRQFEPKLEIKRRLTLNPFKIFAGKRKVKVTHLEGPILYGMGEKNSSLLPFQQEKIYLPKDKIENHYLPYKDFNDTLKKYTF